MTILPNYPMVSQETLVRPSADPDPNGPMDCVEAAVGSGLLWYLGLAQWTEAINPDALKIAGYGIPYTGGTSAHRLVPMCQKLGFKLYSAGGNPGQLVQLAHELLAAGHPVIFTEPDPYDTNPGMTHVCAFYADGVTNGQSYLVAMDPFPINGVNAGHPIHHFDSQWQQLLQFNQIWILEKEEEFVTIDLSMPEIAQRFTNVGPQNDPAWKSALTGKVIHGAILAYYQTVGAKPLSGYSLYGLPKSDEIPLKGTATCQFYERGVLAYDPENEYGKPLGAGDVYPLELYNGGPGTDPMIAQLQAQIAALQASGSGDPALVTSLQAKIANAQKALA